MSIKLLWKLAARGIEWFRLRRVEKEATRVCMDKWWRVIAVYQSPALPKEQVPPSFEWTVCAPDDESARVTIESTWCMAQMGHKFIWSVTEEKPEFIPEDMCSN